MTHPSWCFRVSPPGRRPLGFPGRVISMVQPGHSGSRGRALRAAEACVAEPPSAGCGSRSPCGLRGPEGRAAPTGCTAGWGVTEAPLVPGREAVPQQVGRAVLTTGPGWPGGMESKHFRSLRGSQGPLRYPGAGCGDDSGQPQGRGALLALGVLSVFLQPGGGLVSILQVRKLRPVE